MTEERRRELYDLLGLMSEELDQWGSLCEAEQYLFWTKFFRLQNLMKQIGRGIVA